MDTQTKDRARGVNDHDTAGRETETGFEAVTDLTATLTEQAPEAAAQPRQVQDSLLAVLRHGQDITLTMIGMWTETLRRSTSFSGAPTQARTGIRGGYDLFEQLFASQREFVDRLIVEQRRVVDALLTSSNHR